MPIEVRKIQFGEIDAKNEVFDQNKIGIQVFHNSFEIPPSVDMEKLTSGAKFFVYGQKGCGKTALLLHLKKLLDDSGANTRTILFKSGITEPERQSIASGKGFEIVEQDNIRSVEYDYKINWLWYIYRNLLRMMNPKDSDENSDIIVSLKKIIGVHGEIKTSLLSDLTTKSIKSFARASFTAAGLSSEIGAELETIKNGTQDRIEIEIVDLVERYLPKVRFNQSKRNVLLFDELELFWNRPDQRERDLFLIRDLLYAVSRVNRTVGANTSALGVVASVRSEVLNEVNRVGPEIGRDVDDLGIRVNWNVRSDDPTQPILRIVENKIKYSEIQFDEQPTDDIWDMYFPKSAYSRDFKQYLLDNSMFKPRNIVTLLSLAKNYQPKSLTISTDAIEEVQLEFSRKTWREIEEELSGEYSSDQVGAIKSILTGYRSRFHINDLQDRINELSRIDSRVKAGFSKESDVVKLIQSLYRVGAIGNRYFVQGPVKEEIRFGWIFRDSYEPLLDKEFLIHESLIKNLQLTFANRRKR